jgi:hypothetical protein
MPGILNLTVNSSYIHLVFHLLSELSGAEVILFVEVAM